MLSESILTSPHDAPRRVRQLWVYENRFCGYCMDVRQVIAELGLPVRIRSVADDPAYRSELIRARGRATVPVLRIEHGDGTVRWLAESRDIIAYLYAYAGVPEPRMRVRPYLLLRAVVVFVVLAWALSTGMGWL